MNIYLQLLAILVLARAAAGTIPIPTLPAGQKPNFIVIVTDDQGWDDLGLNNPKYVHTPNLDKFIKGGMLFDNFYTAPQCAQTRAQLLTGRVFARTGTMLTHGCYDFINSDESTMGAVMQDAGYYTAQFGKWHNLDALGYEPWNVGFMESSVPKNQGDMSLMQVNGVYIPNHRRYIEEALSDRILHFTRKQARQLVKDPEAKPFLLFYSPHAVHVTYTKFDNGTLGDRHRFFPPEYKAKYHENPYYKGVPVSTLDVWAMLEYLDSFLGVLFDYVSATPGLRDNTYIMVMSDNGSSLMADEQPERAKYRMPSKVRGNKSTLYEGGIRGWLAVQGPGIPAGVVDSTLLDTIDILPTIVDLAGIEPWTIQHLPWDGMSLKNLLLTPDSESAAVEAAEQAGLQAEGAVIPATDVHSTTVHGPNATSTAAAGGAGDEPYRGVVRRGTVFATSEQWERFVVVLGPQCWDGDLVLALNGDRDVRRPQPLLRWKDGGMINSISGKKGPYIQESKHPGFKMCIAVRHKQYKWLGVNNQVYRLDSRHLESEGALVTGTEGNRLARLFADVAGNWWDQMLAERHSFEKPVFYLGLGNWTVTNMLTCGAYQRTRKTVKLLPIGATGFANPGDNICFNMKVLQNGSYDVTIFYVSGHWSTFKLSVGTHAAILTGSAPAVVAQLPPSSTLAGRQMGTITIPAFVGRKVEACLVLQQNEIPGHTVMKHIANVRLTRLMPPPTELSPSPGDPDLPGGVNDPKQVNQTGTGMLGINSSSLNESTGEPQGDVSSGGTTSDISSSDASADDTPTGLSPQSSVSSHDTPRQTHCRTAAGSTSAAMSSTIPGSTIPGSTTAPVAAAAPGIDVLGQYSWLQAQDTTTSSRYAVTISSSSSSNAQTAWEAIRWQHGWPDGQHVFESMFAPYEWEDIDDCKACRIPI